MRRIVTYTRFTYPSTHPESAKANLNHKPIGRICTLLATVQLLVIFTT